MNNVWQLVTREERIAYMEKNATKDNPIDATFLVTNPGFYFYNGGRGEAYTAGWTISRTGGNFETPCELWCQQSNSTWQSSSFSITQDIADIPNGEYGMTVQAFYRDGWNADVNQMPRAKGTEELRAYYFIGSTEAKVMSVFDAGFMTAPASSELGGFNGAWHGNETLGYMPDNANTFNRTFWFFPDKYVNVPISTIVTDNQTSIGLRKPTGASADWLAFDNFRLYYYGPAVKEIALTNGYATFSASENFKVTTEGGCQCLQSNGKEGQLRHSYCHRGYSCWYWRCALRRGCYKGSAGAGGRNGGRRQRQHDEAQRDGNRAATRE